MTVGDLIEVLGRFDSNEHVCFVSAMDPRLAHDIHGVRTHAAFVALGLWGDFVDPCVALVSDAAPMAQVTMSLTARTAAV